MKSFEQMDHLKLQGIRSNPAAVALKILSRGQNRADGITGLSILVNLESRPLGPTITQNLSAVIGN